MPPKMRRLVKPSVLFAIGGLLYILVELLWRGRTHWTMFIAGGLCFLYIGRINEIFTFEMSIIYQMFISSWLVTFIELIVGMIINSNYAIWDYRNMPLNVMGQACLPYTILWFFSFLPGDNIRRLSTILDF